MLTKINLGLFVSRGVSLVALGLLCLMLLSHPALVDHSASMLKLSRTEDGGFVCVFYEDAKDSRIHYGQAEKLAGRDGKDQGVVFSDYSSRQVFPRRNAQTSFESCTSVNSAPVDVYINNSSGRIWIGRK